MGDGITTRSIETLATCGTIAVRVTSCLAALGKEVQETSLGTLMIREREIYNVDNNDHQGNSRHGRYRYKGNGLIDLTKNFEIIHQHDRQ
jgi:hypothetical protein